MITPVSMDRMREKRRRKKVPVKSEEAILRTKLALMQYRRNVLDEELEKVEMQRQRFMDQFDKCVEEILARQRYYDNKIQAIASAIKEKENQGLTSRSKRRTIAATIGE